MCFTDPPYNVNYQGTRKTRKKMENDNLTEQQFYEFMSWKAEDIPKQIPFPVLSMNLPENIEYLTMEQKDKVLTEIPEKDQPIFAFMMDNGTRIGEARALMKDKIKEVD